MMPQDLASAGIGGCLERAGCHAGQGWTILKGHQLSAFGWQRSATSTETEPATNAIDRALGARRLAFGMRSCVTDRLIDWEPESRKD
jgi:hypothetical protein